MELFLVRGKIKEIVYRVFGFRGLEGLEGLESLVALNIVENS
jgi:hypothetical protein